MRTNENQGKRTDQIEGSYRISFIGLAVLAAVILFLLVMNHFGLLPEAKA
jgi:hypothetical protein